MNRRVKVMAILNVTPDSFSDGGHHNDLETAVGHALAMTNAGADIIDIGGESTRPGAEFVDPETEIKRTVPVIRALRAAGIKTDISIDTRKPVVAKAAIEAGATIWNDVTALGYEAESAEMAAQLGCTVILMHMQGTPADMQDAPNYDNPIAEIKAALLAAAERAIAAGVPKHRLIIDPGIGFGKRQTDNLQIMAYLDDFHALGMPILLGASRKSFIGNIDSSTADERLGGSVAAALWGAAMGADIVRVHDVKETVQALAVWSAIYSAQDQEEKK